MDKLSKERRSWNMSQIKCRDTTPERIVRSILHRLGFRFRLHTKNLPGKPDIVLPKWNLVILVHGCFWHRHARCKLAYTPKTRTQFWNEKFFSNVARDRLVRRNLRQMGWRVHIVWECQTQKPDYLATALERHIRQGSNQ